MRKTIARVCMALTAMTVLLPDVASARPESHARAPTFAEIDRAERDAAKQALSSLKAQDKPKKKKRDKDAKRKKGEMAAPAGAPQPGEPTEVAAQANRLFASKKYWDAAKAFYRVQSGESGDDEGNQQLAEFNLAKTFYNLKLYQPSYGLFSRIVEKPTHIKFNETLLWLAKLATELPESADIIERVGKYDEDHIAQFKNNAEQRELYWHLNYMLGRFKYRNGQYGDAIKLFDKVAQGSKYYVQAKFFTGISYAQMKEGVAATRSFQAIQNALKEGVSTLEDDMRMRDLANLSIARIMYGKAIRVDPTTNAPTISEPHIKVAIEHWDYVDIASEYWLDALFEESWAFYMIGDYTRALGKIHTIQSPYFPNSYFPEAEILKAVIYFSNCQYDDADLIVKKFRQKYDPIKAELEKILAKYEGQGQEEAFYKLLKEVNCGVQARGASETPKSCEGLPTPSVPASIRPIVELSLSDRQLIRTLRYVDVLDEESSRYKTAPESFRSAKAGEFVKDQLHDAREFAVRETGRLAKDRYKRNVDELNEKIRDAQKLAIDVIAAQRNELDKAIANAQVTAEESEFNVVKPDDEHVIWPFDGEYWRDELEFYRQTITSKCGR